LRVHLLFANLEQSVHSDSQFIQISKFSVSYTTPHPLTCLEHTVSILASSLALGSADYSWRDEAVCRDTDPDLFFPIGTTGQALLQIDRAKQVCNECTVQVSCLEFALETNQDSGVWGGTSEEERRDIRRKIAARNRAAQLAARSFAS
jgi:WhiB family redox-sensing transcriptional regulator